MDTNENKHRLDKRAQIKKEIQGINETLEQSEEDEHHEKVFIFISIDIVNSTKYKREQVDWPKDFTEIFDIIRQNFRIRIDALNLWKYVGDEVLFYKQINELQELLAMPSSIFEALTACKEEIDRNIPEARNVIYLKGATWIAAVKDYKDYNSELKNVMPILPETAIDFIGVNIDEGFRISKYTSQGKLVLDAKLAYLLYDNKGMVDTKCNYTVSDRIKIVSYKKMKGIWGERLYPIIWYHEAWDNLDRLFLYDEYDGNEIVREIKERSDKKQALESVAQVGKILSEVGAKKDVERINKILENNKKQAKRGLHIPTYDELIQLRCSVVCIVPDSKELFIVRRCKGKDVSHTWEFGYAKAHKDKPIIEQIKKNYLEDFNLNIELILDTEQNPIPIATYEYELEKDMEEWHKGIVLVAYITGGLSKVTLNPYKHDAYQLLSMEELSDFLDPCVVGLKENARRALETYDTWQQHRLK